MRIGYFGGSFDPPHGGHLLVARAARERFGLDEVWLVPTGRQPLKPEGSVAPFEDRLAMTALLCAGEEGMRPLALDAPLPEGQPNYTADTLAALRESLPAGAELFAIVGADAFLGLPKWHKAAQLFGLAEWIVVSRPGFALGQIETMPMVLDQPARVHLLDGIADPTSATDLRARLRAQVPCEELLPGAVCRYIRARGLYGVA